MPSPPPNSRDICQSSAFTLYISTGKPASNLFESLAVSNAVIKAIRTTFTIGAGTTPIVASWIADAIVVNVTAVLEVPDQKFWKAEIRLSVYLIIYIWPYADLTLSSFVPPYNIYSSSQPYAALFSEFINLFVNVLLLL